VAENRREEQKLWLILFQIKAIRTRLNLLAIQYWLFLTSAVVLGSAAIIFGAALTLSPLAFLVVVLVSTGCAAAALVRVMRDARRQSANPMRAALIADNRAGLKGRLATIQAAAKTPAADSPLWPYLLEDTYGMRETFEPARIEPRWISRSILVPLVVCLLIAAFPLLHRYHLHVPISLGRNAPPAQITADVGNLEIQPADPGLAPNARIYADPATLRQLEAKLAQAERSERNQSKITKWMNQARRLASNLQDRVTGLKSSTAPPIDLRLHGGNPASPAGDRMPFAQADKGAQNSSGSPLPPAPPSNGNGLADQTGPPPVSLPPQQADQLANNNPSLPLQPDKGLTQPDQTDPVPKSGSTYSGGSGSTHSGGADPAHLFGPPTPQQLGSDNFKIAIDASPSDESSSPGAPAYIPPEVHVPLNPEQSPDEPLARAVIPSADQTTVKRVFER
jgi:hypothetical protein